MRKKSTIILFVTSLILAASLVGFLPSSLSIVFDDFDDNATDPTKWITSVTGDEPTISEEQGRLEITLPATSEDAPGQDYFGASYISICQLRGDFDLQVDYLLIDWPSSNGVRVALSLDSNQAPPREYNAARVSFGNLDFPDEPREVYLYSDSDSVNEIAGTDHLSGTLRIQRSASVLTGYYMDGESWVTLDTISVTAADLHFGVSTWSHNYAFANQNVKVAFDNVTILQGEIMCPGASTSTATHTIISTPTATHTVTSIPTPTNTPDVHFIHLPLVAQWPTPTPTASPTMAPTATLTPMPTPTLHPLNPSPGYVAIRPHDVPSGLSVEVDEPEGEVPEVQYAGGWHSWYYNSYVGFGSVVRKYWTPDAALAGYQWITNLIFSTDFYDSCSLGTRAEPAISGTAAYSAIQCQKGSYERTIYLVTYDNVLLEFEFAAPYRAPDIALACEKMMAQRTMGQTEDLGCRSLLASNAHTGTTKEQLSETQKATTHRGR